MQRLNSSLATGSFVPFNERSKTSSIPRDVSLTKHEEDAKNGAGGARQSAPRLGMSLAEYAEDTKNAAHDTEQTDYSPGTSLTKHEGDTKNAAHGIEQKDSLLGMPLADYAEYLNNTAHNTEPQHPQGLYLTKHKENTKNAARSIEQKDSLLRTTNDQAEQQRAFRSRQKEVQKKISAAIAMLEEKANRRSPTAGIQPEEATPESTDGQQPYLQKAIRAAYRFMLPQCGKSP